MSNLRATSKYLKRDGQTETHISVVDMDDDKRLMFWGGVNLMTGKPYIVFIPPKPFTHYSVKQERFFKVFLLAAHLEFCMGGISEYQPKNPYEAFKIVWPREHYPFGSEQNLPEFNVAG